MDAPVEAYKFYLGDILPDGKQPLLFIALIHFKMFSRLETFLWLGEEFTRSALHFNWLDNYGMSTQSRPADTELFRKAVLSAKQTTRAYAVSKLESDPAAILEYRDYAFEEGFEPKNSLTVRRLMGEGPDVTILESSRCTALSSLANEVQRIKPLLSTESGDWT